MDDIWKSMDQVTVISQILSYLNYELRPASLRSPFTPLSPEKYFIHKIPNFLSGCVWVIESFHTGERQGSLCWRCSHRAWNNMVTTVREYSPNGLKFCLMFYVGTDHPWEILLNLCTAICVYIASTVDCIKGGLDDHFKKHLSCFLLKINIF